MSSLPTKESILDSFSQFFQKLVSQHPLRDDLVQNLANFQNLILSDNSNYLQTKTFISSLYQRSLTKPSQPTLNSSEASSSTSSSLPIDTTLKGFSPEKLRYPFSLLTKFTYASFQDYLTKNSISLPVESPLTYRYSHIREFLPDSQNFYRALGLGLLESYLKDVNFLSNVNEWYGKVFHRQVILSTQIYPFSPEELRSTFCGYLKQLLQVREDADETKEGKKSRNLLYQMDSKDTVFDISLISFVKELFITKLGADKDISSNGIENRIKANDSAVISDLLSDIPRSFDVNVIVQIVQNKLVTEVLYNVPGKDPKTCPTLHILNEKQLSYQNFCVLNLDSLENETAADQRQDASHSRNNSFQRMQSLNSSSKADKSLNLDLKTTSERIEKITKPTPQAYGRRNTTLNLYDDIKSASDKSSKEVRCPPLKLLIEGDGMRSDDGDRDEKTITNSELSPSNCVVNLTKMLKGYGGSNHRGHQGRESPPKRMRGIASYKELISQTDTSKQTSTPPKAKKYHFSSALDSPTNYKLHPLTSNPTPRNVLQDRSLSHNTSLFTNNITSELPTHNENFEGEKHQKDIQMHNINILGGILKTRSENTTVPEAKPYSSNDPRSTMKSIPDHSKAEADHTKPKIVTMIPKFMSTVPYNPFSMGISNPGSRLPPSGLQPQDYSLAAARNSDKVGSKYDYGFPSEAGKRFSLNPSSFLNQADYLHKKYNSRDIENRTLNLSTQEESSNENSGIGLDKRPSYRPSANVSLGPYGLESTRMY